MAFERDGALRSRGRTCARGGHSGHVLFALVEYAQRDAVGAKNSQPLTRGPQAGCKPATSGEPVRHVLVTAHHSAVMAKSIVPCAVTWIAPEIVSSGRLRLESIFERKKSKERSARPRARAQRVHAGARVAPSPVALIIEQICVVSDMSGSRNIKTCKTRGRRGGSVVGERAPDILLCCARRASPAARARDPCGTHAQWRLLCYGFLHMACRHAARLRSCAPFAWRCGTGACTHVICIILRAAQCNMWLPGDVPPCMCTTVMEHVMACRRGF